MKKEKIFKEQIFDLANKGFLDKVSEIYKTSTPAERILILKIIGGICALTAFYKYLKSL